MFVPLLPRLITVPRMLMRFAIIGVVLVLIVLPIHIEAFLHLGLNLLNVALVLLIIVGAVVPPFAFLNVCGVVLRFIVLNVVCFCLQQVVGHLVKCQNVARVMAFGMMNSRVALCLFGIIHVGLVVILVFLCRSTKVLTLLEHLRFW